MRKRKEFEDAIRKNRLVMANWFKYTKWEENQGEIQRARLAIFFTESHVFPHVSYYDTARLAHVAGL